MTRHLEPDRAAIDRWLDAPGSRVHMMGVGGIGMAGLARLLAGMGQQVTGCDAGTPRTLDWLRSEGIPVVTGHDPEHLGITDWAVYSPALAPEHPERAAAVERGIPSFRRGDVLAAVASRKATLAVAGTHGKTTTSAMLACILSAAGRKPSWCIGGELPPDGAPAGSGASPWLVIEADESDGSLAGYAPHLALVTNVEYDHMEHFDGPEGLHDCFRRFLAQTTGPRLVCADDPGAAALGREVGAATYGFSESADWRASGLRAESGGTRFSLQPPGGATPVEVEVPLPGRHNVLDAAGAIAAAAIACGVDPAESAAAIASYRPPRRRFETVAEGRGIRVIGDYAHHPTEIRALLDAVRQEGAGRILAVFQPHRYTRTLALGGDFPPAFAGAARVLLLPVYAASEKPLAGGTSADLLERFRADAGAPPTELCRSFDDAVRRVAELWRPGDRVLLVGAGDIESIGPVLRNLLERPEP